MQNPIAQLIAKKVPINGSKIIINALAIEISYDFFIAFAYKTIIQKYISICRIAPIVYPVSPDCLSTSKGAKKI